MKYKEIKLALIGLMALAVMPMVAGATLADSGSGSGGSGARSAELFLGGCPGAPCADIRLSLDGDGLKASADGFGFPLDDDETGMLNRYAMCVDDIFIGDDQVKSTDRRVVEDDGVVDISGDVGVSFTTLLGRVVKIVDIGDHPASIGIGDDTCNAGILLLQGTVGFRNLR